MINVRKSLRRYSNSPDINISPLIDLIFLLLIFFIVTTSFVKEAGVNIKQPESSTASLKDKGSLLVGISKDGTIYIDKKRVDIRVLGDLIERELKGDKKRGVVIVADKESETGDIIAVMDECRLVGVKNISIAAKKKGF